jgi:hypothetical protein
MAMQMIRYLSLALLAGIATLFLATGTAHADLQGEQVR